MSTKPPPQKPPAATPTTVDPALVKMPTTALTTAQPTAATGRRIPPQRITYAQTRSEVSQACDFDHPLEPTDSRWQDLTPARGDHSVQRLQARLENKPADTAMHLVFASHRGAGKTTELARLAKVLWPRYLPMYLDANVEMDPNRIDAEDLLLVLSRWVERLMRERGTPLPNELLERINQWFSEVIHSTSWGRENSVDISAGLKVDAGLPLIAKLMASVTSLFKYESKHREEVKGVLKKYPGTLLDSVNALLAAANEILAAQNQELLVIIDNLDRYEPQVIDELLVRNGDRVRNLACNLILTPPISLIYRPHSENLDARFPVEIMNTVRLRKPDQPYDAFDGPGRELLLKALAHRVDLDTLLPDMKARDRLVTASGGGIRELLSLVSDASLNARGSSITLDAIESTVKGRKQRLRDLVNANGWWPTLARIAKDKQLFADESCLRVLYLRLVFKYNGDGWYDVHPLLTELPEFQQAAKQLSPSAT